MIGLIQTGGTIGSDGDPQAPIPSARFRELWDRLMPAAPFPIHWYDTPKALDSTEITPADWAVVMGLALDAVEAGAEGVVVLHGTDTMAQSAAALAFLSTRIADDGTPKARLGVPLVITGSMRPLFEGETLRNGSDAQANATGAIRLAASGAPETHLFFAGRTLPAASVVKADDRASEAFVAPKGAGEPAELPPAKIEKLRAQLDTLAPLLGRKAVLSWLFEPSAPEHHARALEGAIERLGGDLGAIHLVGFGTGNIPAGSLLLPILQAARDRGVLIAVGTNVHRGRTDTGIYAAGAWTAEAGALPAHDMTIPATHAKLHVAMALAQHHRWDRVTTERFFSTPIAGERSAE